MDGRGLSSLFPEGTRRGTPPRTCVRPPPAPARTVRESDTPSIRSSGFLRKSDSGPRSHVVFSTDQWHVATSFMGGRGLARGGWERGGIMLRICPLDDNRQLAVGWAHFLTQTVGTSSPLCFVQKWYARARRCWF